MAPHPERGLGPDRNAAAQQPQMLVAVCMR